MALQVTWNSETLYPERPLQRHAPAPNPDRFRCQLDSQPGFLVPRRLLTPQLGDFALHSLDVNPASWWSRSGPPPAEIQLWGALTEGFDWAGEAVWVAGVDGRLFPFTMGCSYQARTARFRCGEPAPNGLSLRELFTLTVARVLIDRDLEERERAAWRRTLSNAKRDFESGYAAVAGLIHPFHLGELRRYYRYLIRSGRLQLGDGQSSRRYVAHEESVTRFFHYQLAAVVSAVAGQPVKPSYCYIGSYQSGAMLPRHLDREQCEFSVTVLIDYSPEPTVESPWPIHLDTPTGSVTVYQAIGDGLFYRGRSICHYRTPLAIGATSTSVFFHYVPESFAGRLT
jgi:hypothetical protein